LRALPNPPRKPRKAGGSATATGKNKTKAQGFPTAAAVVAECEKRLGPRSAWWTYHDAGGKPVAVVVRWDNAGGKEFRLFAKIDAGWRIGDPDGLWPLYRLPAVLQSQGRVYLCEGEKAADAVRSLGLTATTSAHGANSVKRTDWTPLAGRQVVILPDHDDAGVKYAEEVVTTLDKVTPRPIIKVVHLPGLLAQSDAVEYIAVRRAAGLDDAAKLGEVCQRPFRGAWTAAKNVWHRISEGCAALWAHRAFLGIFKYQVLAALTIGVLVAILVCYAGPWIGVIISGTGGFLTTLAVQVGLWLRKALAIDTEELA
jgi:uncharacterized membrane protein